MTSSAKKALGVATFGPSIATFWIMGNLLIAALLSPKQSNIFTMFMLCSFYVVWPIGILSGITAYIVCGRHLQYQLKLRGWHKWTWFAFLAFAWPISTPFYWHRFIWKENERVNRS